MSNINYLQQFWFTANGGAWISADHREWVIQQKFPHPDRWTVPKCPTIDLFISAMTNSSRGNVW